jgi:protein SCO1/2
MNMQFSMNSCSQWWRSAVLTTALLCLVISGTGMTWAQAGEAATRPAQLLDVGIDQRLNAQVPLDLPFRDEEGRTVKLADFFGKKPVILSLVYYACPMLCTTAENGLLEAVKQLKFDAGKEFEILTVSFDPNDKPMNARAKKSVYVGLYGRPGGAQGWHFLTGDQESIRRLTEAVGFHYTYDESSREFAHATGIMVITPTGRISHYFYGIQYPAGDLRLALVEASNNTIGNPVDAVLLFCSHYDPAIGKYGFVISRVLQLAGLATVVSIATLLLVMFWTERRGKARLAQPL